MKQGTNAVGRCGCMAWLPGNVLEEAEKIRREKGLRKRADALDELVKYARVGREAEKIKDIMFLRRGGRL